MSVERETNRPSFAVKHSILLARDFVERDTLPAHLPIAFSREE